MSDETLQITDADIGKQFRRRDGVVVTVMHRFDGTGTPNAVYSYAVKHPEYTVYKYATTSGAFYTRTPSGKDLIVRVGDSEVDATTATVRAASRSGGCECGARIARSLHADWCPMVAENTKPEPVAVGGTR